MKRKGDIFNSENKKGQKFFRKSNVKKIIILSVLAVVFLYGAREFIYGETISVEILDINFKEINSMNVHNGSSDYFIVNKSPYMIKLRLVGSVNFTSNYEAQSLRPKQVFHLRLRSDQKGVVNVEWIKE